MKLVTAPNGQQYWAHITHYRSKYPRYLESLEQAIYYAYCNNQIRMHEKYFNVDSECKNTFETLYEKSMYGTDLPWSPSFTRVSLFNLLDREGKQVISIGYAFCSPNEKNFNKKLGVRIAISRAMSKLEQ